MNPELTRAWTDDLVVANLAEALRVIGATVQRDRPAGYGSSMPDIIREFHDYAGRDEEPGVRIEQWMAEIEATIGRQFSSGAIETAETILRWPSRFLADQPLERDAVWLMASCAGLGAHLEKILRRRRQLADRMVERRKEGNPDLVRIYEDDAGDAAAKVVYWANAALSKTVDPRAIARIRKGARIRFAREIRSGKIIERFTYVRRCDVIPDKIYTTARVHHYHRLGAARIAEGLNGAGERAR